MLQNWQARIFRPAYYPRLALFRPHFCPAFYPVTPAHPGSMETPHWPHWPHRPVYMGTTTSHWPFFPAAPAVSVNLTHRVDAQWDKLATELVWRRSKK